MQRDLEMYSPQMLEMISPLVQADRLAEAKRKRQIDEVSGTRTRLTMVFHRRLTRLVFTLGLRARPIGVHAHGG
jgi:hypothetical protein